MKFMNMRWLGDGKTTWSVWRVFLFFLTVGNDILASDPFTQKLMIIFWFKVNPLNAKCILLFTCLFIHSFTFV